jgi:integrase
MSRPYKKTGNDLWYGYRILSDGRRVTRSLGTADNREAVRRLREFERETDPTAGASKNHTAHTVEDAVRFIVENGCQDAAPSTWDMWSKKGGHLARLVGPLQVSHLHIDDVQGYIAIRLQEGAARETVRKELSTLRKALEEARARGLFSADPRSVVPKFKVIYRPRTRFLRVEEFQALLSKLEPHRIRWVALAVYGGLRRSEVEALRWEEHVDEQLRWIRVPGTKTAGSSRRVPVPAALANLLRDVEGRVGVVVLPWQNVGRDLPAACSRAGIPRATPNDLRRTFASWLKNAGQDSAVVAKLLGHSSTRMVDLVYGRLTEETLAAATDHLPVVPMGSRGGSRSVAESGATVTLVTTSENQAAEGGPVAAGASPCVKPLKMHKTRQDLRPGGPSMFEQDEVPGPGIEPGTRGFSVPCSTS